MGRGTTSDLDEPVLRHVRRDFASLRDDLSVGEALAGLRGKELPSQIVYFYVVDAEQRLVGVVPTRRLLMAPLDRRVGDLAVTRVVTLPDTATVLEACEVFILHRFLALPVVDGERRLIGVLDISLFTEEMQELSEHHEKEAAFQLIGIKVESGRTASPLVAFRNRFPWLISNIVGGVICAVISGFYETVLAQAIILALFIPVVLALSESVSIQSVTLTLQRLHGERTGLWRALGRELPVGILLGIASGLLVGLAALVWKQDLYAALVIWLAILLAMATACALGVLLPTAVHRFGRDPRVAAGPIVLATGDVACLLFYFNLASWLLAKG